VASSSRRRCGIVTSLKDDEIKITDCKKGEKEGEEKTFKVSKDVKTTAKKGKVGEAKEMTIDKATKSVEKQIEKRKAKGAFATIDVVRGKVISITFGAGKGKKGGK
jgi:hypothetical protein